MSKTIFQKVCMYSIFDKISKKVVTDNMWGNNQKLSHNNIKKILDIKYELYFSVDGSSGEIVIFFIKK